MRNVLGQYVKGHTLGFRKGYTPANKGNDTWGVYIQCKQCKNSFKVKKYRLLRSKNLFCKLDCIKEWYKTQVISSENKRIRKSKKFADWRKAVFERDDYTCQFCGDRGKELHPDHIKQFAYFPKLRFELSNGRTLCAPCHRKTPTWGWHGRKAVAEQWDESFNE